MKLPDLAAGIVARNFEISFLFPETATQAVVEFLRRQLTGYHYRRYRIEDRYFTIQADGASALARQRTENRDGIETVNLIVPCKTDRYVIVPDKRLPTDADTILSADKQRDDWTRRAGPRLGGRHYGAFARVSIDAGETAALPSAKPRRTFPGSNVIEFEYAGSGKREIDLLLAAFRSFCAKSSIELADRPRGAAHRMAILRQR